MGVRGKVVLATIVVPSLLVVAVDPGPTSAQADCPDINVAAVDGGSGLNAAIEAADACIGPQTITVESGTYTRSSAYRIDDEVTITGADPADPPVITGMSLSSSAFSVDSVTGPVELRHLDVQGGLRTGLLSIVRSTVVLDDVDFTGTASGCGISTPNGIRADGGDLTVRSSTIARSGCDGISAFNDSTVVLDDVVLAEHGQRGLRLTGSMEARNSEFHGNGLAGVDATGTGTTVLIEDSFVHDNRGVGITVSSGSLDVRRTAVGLAPDGAGGTVPAGNAEAGIESLFTDLTLGEVEVAHNAVGVAVFNATIAAITGSSIHDNVGTGLALSRSTVELATSGLVTNNPNCTFFRSSITDGGGNTDDDGTCGIVSNAAPVASPDTFAVGAGATLAVPAPGVLENDTDPDGDAISAVPLVVDGLDLAADGSLTYTPPPDRIGEQTFTYEVTDGSATDTSTITIDVLPEPAGGIHTWMTAGLDPATACNDSYRVDGEGRATGELAIDVGAATDVWLCASILNQTNRTLEQHRLVGDPDITAVVPPTPFDLTIAANAIAQRVIGPFPVALASATDVAGWDLAWTVTTPDASPPIEGLSGVEIRPDIDDLPSVHVDPATTTESGDLEFTLTLRRPESVDPVAEDVSVRVRTDGRTATDDADFAPVEQVVSFASGGVQTVIVDVVDDSDIEPEEVLQVTLSEPAGLHIADREAAGRIVDDDGPPSAAPLVVRVGTAPGNACDGPVDTGSAFPRGELILPPGSSADRPLFYCASFTSPPGPDALVHVLSIDGAGPGESPFAPIVADRIGPGRSLTRIVGPISRRPSANWTWRADLDDGGFLEASAETRVVVEEFTGVLDLDVGMVPDAATPCADAVDPLIVPFEEGPESPDFRAWYCARATNGSDVALLTNGIALASESGPVTVPIGGAIGPGETRTIRIGPRADHPIDPGPVPPVGPQLVYPRDVRWVAVGPSEIGGVDDLSVVTVRDDATVERTLEGAPLVEVASGLVVESDEGIRPFDVTIRRGPGLTAPVDVAISVRPIDDGSPAPTTGTECVDDVDYVATVDDRTISPDVAPAPFPILICGDRVDEDDERILVEVIERLGDGSLGDVLATGVVRIIDTDAPLRVDGPPPLFEFVEGDGAGTPEVLVIDLAEPAESPRSLLVFADGSAEASLPCGVGGDLFLPDGASAGSAVRVDAAATAVTLPALVCSDGLPEPTESLVLSFTDLFTNELQFTALVTIEDDDTFPLLAGRSTVDWEDALDSTVPAEFDVITPAEVPWFFDADLTANNGTVGAACIGDVDVLQPFSPQSLDVSEAGSVVTVPITVCADAEIEDDMTLELTLTPTGAFEPGQAVPATATVVVRDDDEPPQIALQTDAEVVEGTGGGITVAEITVPVIATTDVPLYLTHLVPLIGDGDVLFGPLGTCGPLADLPTPTFPISGRIEPGDTEVVYEVQVCADADPEDDEVARFQVMNKEETRALGQVALTIVDDDTTDVPVIVTQNIDVLEGDATLDPLGLGRDISPTFDVAATARIDQQVVIEKIGGDAAVGVIGLPPGEPACIGPSFAGDPGAIFPTEPVDLIATTLLPRTVATGSTSITIPLVVCGDHRPEADETATFRITLFDPLDPSPPVLGEFDVTVRDDDTDRPAPVVSIDDPTYVEGTTLALLDARPVPVDIDVIAPIDEDRLVVIDVAPDTIGGPNLTVAPVPGIASVGVCAEAPTQQDLVLPIPFVLPAGEASVPTQLGLCADRVLEPDERVRLRLRELDPTDPQSTLFDPVVLAEFVVTVTDDDELVLDVDPIEVIEGTAEWADVLPAPTRDPALDVDVTIGISPPPALASSVLVEPVGGGAAVGVAPQAVGEGDLGCLGPVGAGEPGVILPDEPVDLVALVAQPILVPPDATEFGLRVAVCPDHRVEPDETAEFRIVEFDPLDPNPSELGRFTITLLDDDAGRVLPEVTVEDVSAREAGPVGSNTATATIVVDTPPSVGFLATLDVDPVSLGGPNATVAGLPGFGDVACPPTIPFTPGTDAALPIPFVIPTDATSVDLPITICGDDQPEPTERVRLRVREFDPTDPQLTILDPTVLDDFVLTIEDDDVLPGITATDDAGVEGELLTATFTFDAPLSGDTTLWAGTRVVGPQPVPGDALIPCTAEFVPLEPFFTPVLLGAGTTGFTVDVTTCDDAEIEADETFLVDVYDAPEFGNRLATARMTMIDDDEPELRGVDIEVAEEVGTAEVRFVVDRAAGSAVFLWARTTDGTAIADDDYVPLVGTAPPLLFAAGSTAPVIVPVTIKNDVFAEPPQTFTVGLFDQAIGGRLYAEATVTITDTDRNTPVLAAPTDPVEYLEDDFDDVRFDVVTPATGFVDLVVSARPIDPVVPVFGSCPVDPNAQVVVDTGPVQLAPNVESFAIGVGGCDDLVIEPDVIYEVVISTDTGVELAAATVVMLDDDRPPVVDLLDLSIAEGDPVGFSAVRGIDIELDVIEAPLRPYTLVVEPTGTGSAVNGACDPIVGPQPDYQFLGTSTVTVEPDQTGRIAVMIGGVCLNTLQEPDVSYGVRVVDGPGESGGVNDSATVTIVDDDDTVVLNALDAQVVEGDGGERTVEVEVEVLGAPQTPLDLRWSTQRVGPGLRPATAGLDYETSSGVVPPTLGGGSRTIEFTVFGDEIVEGDEWFEVEITSTNATVADGLARVRIVDDEQVSASIADADPVEEGDAGDVTTMTFDVALDAPIGSPVTVEWATHDRSGVPVDVRRFPATGDGPSADFVGASGALVFQPGGPLTRTVSVEIVGDDDEEFPERVYVHLIGIGGPGSPSIADGEAFGRIDNDDEIVFVSNGPPLILGDGPGTGSSTVEPGGTVGVPIVGLAPNTPVIVQIRSTPRDLAFATTDANGSVTIEVTIPSDMSLGRHTIVVTGVDAAGRLSEIRYPITIFDPARCTVTGTSGRDLLFGTSGDDVICALGGRDIVFAFDGDDVVFGGDGRDLIFGGRGDDRLLGEGGRDLIFGGPGDDQLFGGPGRDLELPGLETLGPGPNVSSVSN